MKTFVYKTCQQKIPLAQRREVWGEVDLTCGTAHAPTDRVRGAGGEVYWGSAGSEEEEGCPGQASSGSGFIQAWCWQTPCREVELL